VRVALASDAVALSALGALTAALLVATWGTWGDLDSDTGYDAAAGARVADGDLPYRDFVYYYGPLAPLASGLATLIGGHGLAPNVALGLVIAIAIVLATYALGRTVCGPLGALLASAMTAAVAFIPNNYSFVLPHTHAATLGTLAILLLLLFARRYAGSGRVAWLLGAGACVGLAGLTKPEPALAALVAGLTWIVLRGRAGARLRYELALFGAAALAIPLAVYGAFATAVPVRELFLENLYPADELAAGGDALVRVRMPLTLESVVELGGKLALYAAGCAALVALARAIDGGGRWRRPLVLATAAGALMVAAVAMVKPDGIRDILPYLFGWIPAGAVIAVAVLLRRFRRRAGRWEEGAQVELAAAVALAVLAATAYGAFVFHGWRPQMAVYVAPLAALLIVRLHLGELARSRTAYVLGAAWIGFLVAVLAGLTLKDSHAESATVRGPGGSIAAEPAEAALYQGAVDAIVRRTEPGAPILVAPMMTGLTVLADRETPLRELSLLPSALPEPADERAAIARLEAAGVRVVITDDRDWKGYGHGAFGTSFHRGLAFWVKRNFVKVQTLTTSSNGSRSLDIWERRAR
jgi:4-amino-4-deoxy-L-arabinose transferase-like glycosyltransferase